MWTWRSGRAHGFGDEGREFNPGSIQRGFCPRLELVPINGSCSSHLLKYTLQMLLPMGRQVARSHLAVILDTKELATQFLKPLA